MRKKLAPENLSILIVDDVKSMRSILRSMLKNLKIGGTLHMAENGAEGLKILNGNPVDLAIIDWRMPVMNGTQLLESIRKDPGLRDIPVLMVSGESEKDIVLEAAEIEVEGYLLKPLTPAVLEEKILAIVDQANHPDKATLHVREARKLEETGNVGMAIKHMACAVELKPGASRLLRKLALLYRENGDRAAMERYLTLAVSANQNDVVSRKVLGDYYWEAGKWESAAYYYCRVVSMTRKFSGQAIRLGAALLENNYSGHAKKLFSKIISKSPKNISLTKKIVDICIDRDEWEYARILLEKLIRMFPSNDGLIYQAGSVCEMLDRFDEALEYYLTVDKQGFSQIDVKLKIAKILIRKKKIIQADDYLNMVLKKDPQNTEALDLRRLV